MEDGISTQLPKRFCGFTGVHVFMYLEKMRLCHKSVGGDVDG